MSDDKQTVKLGDLNISKVTTPIGVIAVIYESRPNVTSDIASLCFKSGNPVILKGGTEAYYSNKILTDLFRHALEKNKINKNYVQFINLKKRKVVDYLLTKMINYIDVIITFKNGHWQGENEDVGEHTQNKHLDIIVVVCYI